MKWLVKYLLVVICSLTSFSQIGTRDNGRIISGSNFNFFDNLKISYSILNSDDENTIMYEDIEGSPYIDNNITIGKIYSKSLELIKTAFVRYNAYTDNMEVSLDEEGSDYYLIKKLPDFLYFELNNKIYKAFEYNLNSEKIINYFVILADNDKNKSTLLNKETIIFKKGKKPESSFLTPTNHRFVRAKDKFYIKIDDQILEVPKKIKDLPKLFGDKKTEIEAFIASSKIKSNSGLDLLNIVNYYNSLFN